MQLFANNAISTLAGAITNIATAMSVQPGHGARFPSPTAGDYFLLTLFELVAGIETNHEIVKVTARSVDTLTIVRAQESTTARAFGTGAQASGRATAGTLAHLAQTDMPTTFTQPVTILTAAQGTNTTQAASTAFVSTAVAQAKADLVASSPAALDTLNELAAALGNDANFAASTATALGNRLRVDVAQGLTAPQKAQAVANLGLATVATSGLKADIGLGNVDNTSDASKPVSSATQTALNLKANSAAPVFTTSVATTDAPLSMDVTTGGAARNFALTQATAGSLSVKISAAAGGSAVAGATVASFSAAGMALTGALNASSGSASIPALRTVGASTAQGRVVFGSVDDLYGIAAGADYAGMLHDVAASKIFAWYAGGIERMRISAAGNLLVGTPTDNGIEKLQVNGPARFANSLVLQGAAATTAYFEAVGNNGTAGTTSMMYGQDIAGTGYVWNRATADVVIGTVGAERMRVKASGNVLIGTATDNGVDKLQVVGTAKVAGGAGTVLTVSGTTNAKLQITSSVTSAAAAPRLEFLHAGNDAFVIEGGSVLTFMQSGVNERMRISAAGNVLIGTATDNGTDKLQVNGKVSVTSNANGSVGASLRLQNQFLSVNSDTRVDFVSGDQDGNATSRITGVSASNGSGSIAGHLSFSTKSPGTTGVGLAERMRIDSAGNLLVGTTTNQLNSHVISNPSQAQEAVNLHLTNCAVFSVGSSGYGNSAACTLKMNANTVTGRTLNAGGTINASGADYAEYMTKAVGVGEIAKGDIVGVTADGRITDRWADAISFMVKSTDPSIVGGDRWGTEEVLGVAKPKDSKHKDHAKDLAKFEAKLEAARHTVDRIAYAGQVPVNVQGAKPGQFLLPVQAGSKIGCIVVDASRLTMEEYIRTVGIVQNILPDGRANIRVKVA